MASKKAPTRMLGLPGGTSGKPQGSSETMTGEASKLPHKLLQPDDTPIESIQHSYG